MLNLLIADDFPLFRRGVKELLADGLGAVKLGECDNSHDLLELVRRQKWDLVILDITMPGSTGTETLKQLKSERPELPVIVLSMHPEDQYAVRMFKAGAD
jgi:two-component system invasion response regulator UvrY